MKISHLTGSISIWFLKPFNIDSFSAYYVWYNYLLIIKTHLCSLQNIFVSNTEFIFPRLKLLVFRAEESFWLYHFLALYLTHTICFCSQIRVLHAYVSQHWCSMATTISSPGDCIIQLTVLEWGNNMCIINISSHASDTEHSSGNIDFVLEAWDCWIWNCKCVVTTLWEKPRKDWVTKSLDPLQVLILDTLCAFRGKRKT